MYQEVTSGLPATATSAQRHALDLQSGVTAQLLELGVPVRDTRICTQESPDYFSFRGGDLEARQAGVISL
jgi:copper oxidase (laccase) domain-containing protein